MNPPAERVLRLLADQRNRAILTVLEDAAAPLSVDELVTRLDAQAADAVAPSGGELDRETLRIRLHHDALPKLEDAGLVTYDRAQNVVAVEQSPVADAESLDLGQINEVLADFDPGADVADDAIGVLEGRESIIDYGRHLVDEAEDELFLMYVSEDLLQEECLRRVNAALERDVDVSLGSKNPDVLELTRDHLPGVTVWEPQLDWWDEPSSYPTVGRLIFADRERIMLAILKESDLDGTTTEMAIMGDGPENPLVVLARQLLGPRLDHLDYQSEEFLDDLPFES